MKTKTQVHKHPLAIARDEWLSGMEGQRCADLSTLSGTQYLINRLEVAFLAGAKAQEVITRHACAEAVIGVGSRKHSGDRVCIDKGEAHQAVMNAKS